MSVLRRCGAFLVAATLAFASVDANGAGGGSFGVVSPKAPVEGAESAGTFDALRKPPVPVSFLPHDKGWIQFQYPPSARDRVAPLIGQADDLRAELAEDLGQTPLDGVEVRIARGPEEMATLAPQGLPPGAQAVSVAYAKLKLIVLSLASTVGATDPAELSEGFRRELARIALAEAVGWRTLPAWFVDGFARLVAREGEWTREWTLYRASVRHRVPSTSELDGMIERESDTPLASAEAVGLVAFLSRPEKHVEFAAAIERLRLGDDLQAAISSGYGLPLAVIERHWRAELSRRTTLTTIFSSFGIPGLLLGVWALVRAVRRHRARLAAKRDSKRDAGEGTSNERARVHIVLSRRDERLEPPVITEPEVPKVEHEGEWHTLH